MIPDRLPRPAPAWRPLLTGDDAVAARRAILAVADGLRRHRGPSPDDPTLTEGVAGDALLYAHLLRAGIDGPWLASAEACLDAAVDGLARHPLGASLYVGFPGVAWAVERVTATVPPDGDPRDEDDDPNAEIDDALASYLDTRPWTAHFDLIGGLTGLGVYALDRLARPRGPELLAQVVARLGELAHRGPDGVAWPTRPDQLPAWQRELTPHGYWNLGVAHGAPGVIALLAHAASHGVAGARPLLDGAVAWLLAQERPCGASRFPVHVPQGDVVSPPHESRVAWCYGDLGLSVALLGAARRAGRADWEREALRIAAGAAARPPDRAGARDACLCHGAAGNLHLFNRLWQATGDDRFAAAARAWFARTMTYADLRHPLAGFQTLHLDDDGTGRWEDAAGLLEGSCGVALALVAAIDDHAPTWDRVLLADVD